jgi:hypothetical protein
MSISLSDLKAKLKANREAIQALEVDTDQLTWAYVHGYASNPTCVDDALKEIKDYLAAHYPAESITEFIEMCKKNLTMAPIKTRIFRISKYNTRVKYDTVLYEWNGKRVMYVRASGNCDNYYAECDAFNGFRLNDFESTRGEFPSLAWWKTDEPPIPYAINTLVENRIRSSLCRPAPIGFDTCVADIPEAYKLVVALFDLSDGDYHHLLREDKIEDVACVMPYD